MLGRVFKAYDVRGTYPDLLNDQMAWQIGVGCSRFLLDDAAAAGETTPMMKTVVVGRDMRQSSPKLAKELISGLTLGGANVIDVGMVDTSFIYFAVNYLDCAGGVMVTASHNPPNYNGFKVSKRKAKPVGEQTGLAEVRKHAAMADRSQAGQSGDGRVEQRDLWGPYAEHVLSNLDRTAIASAAASGGPMRIVIDASNGMAGTMVPQVFGRNGRNVDGVQIVEVNYENDKGEFVHEPNPLVEANLQQVKEAVVREKAQLGFCFDGDADRCMAVDERGRTVPCDLLTALLAPYFLEKEPGSAIIFDLRSSRSVPDEVSKAGGRPVRSQVGHVNMKAEMASTGAVFGGELSGHFYFKSNYSADSGAIAMCHMLNLAARSGRPFGELIDGVKRYEHSGEINFEIEDKDGALDQVRERYIDRGELDELDGVTIDCFEEEGWWANIRKSNTEPLLRLNAEAKDAAKLAAVLEEMSPLLGTRVAH